MDYLEQLEIDLEWRDIKGYEGHYRISEYGDVMSLKGKKKLLRPGQACGYLKVSLSKNGIIKSYLVHRLVATAFCNNPNKYEEVNHIDENKINNHYSNLEWCNHKYNMNYGTRNTRVSEKMIGNNNGGRKVKCIELNMVFDSVTKAAEYVNGKGTAISASIAGKRKTHRGYHWEYID